MKKLLVATSNPGKLVEIKKAFKNIPFEIVSSRDLKLRDDFEETGATHQEVALNKAKFYYKQAGFLTLAEDSGLVVDALAGELGLKTRRWGAGEKASDQEWVDFFLDRMAEVPAEKRGAHFVCCAALIDENGKSNIFMGDTEGFITAALEAPIKAGLPLSSCFRPKGFDKVYAALSEEEKNLISHRGKTMALVREFLEKIGRGE